MSDTAKATVQVQMNLPISPADLSPTLWLKADDLVDTHEDEDLVSEWVDASGNGHVFSQATESERPVFVRSALNDRPALSFDGDNDNLASASTLASILAAGGIGMIVAVARPAAADQSTAAELFRDAAPFKVNFRQMSTGNFQCDNRDSGGVDSVAKAAAFGAWHTYIWGHDSVNLFVAVDDADNAAAVATASGATASLAGAISIGFSGNQTWWGDIAEIIAFSYIPSEEDRRRLVKYLVEKYALTGDSTTAPADEWMANPDVVSGIKAKWGIQGASPKDRVASVGTLSFALDNSDRNSGGVRGYYSPGHARCRAGFGIGAEVRLVLSHPLLGERVRWVGTIKSALPGVGIRDQRTAVSCVDWMEEASRAHPSGLEVLIDTQADEVFESLLGAVPNPPPDSSASSGSDVYPYALDNVQDESSTLIGEFQKLAESEFGQVVCEAGRVRFEGRSIRAAGGDPKFTLDEGFLIGVSHSNDRDDVLNNIQVQVHPRRVDSSPVTLFTLGAAQQIQRKTSIVFNAPYRDPNQEAQRVGGIDMINPVATTDYLFNSAEDGSGTDLTSQLTVTPTFGGNSAEVEVYNDGPQDGYLLGSSKIRGTGVYDFSPVILRAVDGAGENAFTYNMPYQSSPSIGSDTAAFILGLFKDPKTRVQSVTFWANWDEEKLVQAFDRSISDKVAVNIPPIGVDLESFFINGIALDISVSGAIKVTWTVAPADDTEFWVLELDGQTELDETTVLGYGLFVQKWILGVDELGSTTFLN